MRRQERKIESKEAMEEFIRSENILRLGMSVDNMPYIVPVNYGYANETFYIHCALEGRKLDMIRKNPRVCFEIDGNHRLVTGQVACSYTMKYTSIIGYGKAEILEEHSDKVKALDVIMAQFSNQAFTYPDKAVAKVAIIKISVDEMSGKASQ